MSADDSARDMLSAAHGHMRRQAELRNAGIKLLTVGLGALALFMAFRCYAPMTRGWDFGDTVKWSLARAVDATERAGHTLTRVER